MTTHHSPHGGAEGTGGSLRAAPVPRHPLVADADRMLERLDRALEAHTIRPPFEGVAVVGYDPSTDELGSVTP